MATEVDVQAALARFDAHEFAHTSSQTYELDGFKFQFSYSMMWSKKTPFLLYIDTPNLGMYMKSAKATSEESRASARIWFEKHVRKTLGVKAPPKPAPVPLTDEERRARQEDTAAGDTLKELKRRQKIERSMKGYK